MGPQNLYFRIAQQLQFWACVVIAGAMPFSNLFMSLGMFVLAGSVIIQNFFATHRASWKQNMRQNMQRLGIVPMLALFALMLIGMTYSEELEYALWDLKMKLPLFVIPMSFLFGRTFHETERRRIIGVFILSTAIACTFCLASYLITPSKLMHDARHISMFISHIRFSMMIILAAALLFTSAWSRPFGKALTMLLLALFGVFIYLASSITGLVLIVGWMAWGAFYWIRGTDQNKRIRVAAMTSLIGIFALGIFWIARSYTSYFDVHPLTNATRSAGGEPYADFQDYPLIENGHYVMEGVAWSELYRCWSRRSAIAPDSLDGGGHLLKGTLIRYLGNQGLLKDSTGIQQLSDIDISNIEAGLTQPDIQLGLNSRLNKVWFEWSNYKAGGNTSGHSVLQRVEFLHAASFIIRQHPLFGVGTGDVAHAFSEAYDALGSSLDQKHRLRAHNQYLTLWISAGILGLIALLFWLYQIFSAASWMPNARAALCIIVTLSFLTEDTLETTAGVVFVSFFAAFFADTLSPNTASLPQQE